MSGQYYQPPPQPYPPHQPHPGHYNPEADSIKSMVNIASIFGILISVVMLLVALWYIYAWATYQSVLNYWGVADPAPSLWIVMGIFCILGFVFGLIFFMQCKGIGTMVGQGRYMEAKSKTLLWMIIGFIFVGVIPGILLLIAYMKFDPLIRGAQPNYYPPPPQQYQQPYQQQYQQPQQQYQQHPPQQGQYPPQQPPPNQGY